MKILSVSESADIVLSGGVVIVPTDSCFGLAGNAMDKNVVEHVLSLKGRAGNRPPAIFVPDVDECHALVSLKRGLRERMTVLFPGPVTVLVTALPNTPRWLCDPEGRIGIRIVNHVTLGELLRESGLFLTATSANITGHAPPYTSDDLNASPLTSRTDGVLIGSCGGLPPSTVIDLSGDRPTLIREGPVGFNEVKKRLEEIL